MQQDTYKYLERSSDRYDSHILNCMVYPTEAKQYLNNLKQKKTKTKELMNDVNLLKSLGAKDAITVPYSPVVTQAKFDPQ